MDRWEFASLDVLDDLAKGLERAELDGTEKTLHIWADGETVDDGPRVR
jgi:hypothetical protein